MEDTGISNRKAEHLKIVLENDVSSDLTTGLEQYAFLHQALPDIDLNQVDLATAFLGKALQLPLLISSMTGGTPEAQRINTHLAIAAQQCKVALGTGSFRAGLENNNLVSTFAIRKYAPDIPILANLGAIQLNYGFGLDECKKAVDLLQADALILHLNPLQEALQPEGNIHWKGLRGKIEKVIHSLGMPVIIKEVGWGMDAVLVKQLHEMGVYAIDLAGAGGTSWSQVELYRLNDPAHQRIAAHFRGWGIPTARALVQAHHLVPDARLIASGGLKNGIDLCKCIGLGAELAGMAAAFLQAADRSEEDVIQMIEDIRLEMKICMFAAGIPSIAELKDTPRLLPAAA
jgi:isopentenyl-diphosphate delta-isomerase